MKNINELAEAYNRLQKIEREIEAINQLADHASEDDMSIGVLLSATNITRSQAEHQINQAREMEFNGVIVLTSPQAQDLYQQSSLFSVLKKHTTEFHFEVKESTAMKLLGILLSQKLNDKNHLMEEIKRLNQ